MSLTVDFTSVDGVNVWCKVVAWDAAVGGFALAAILLLLLLPPSLTFSLSSQGPRSLLIYTHLRHFPADGTNEIKLCATDSR